MDDIIRAVSDALPKFNDDLLRTYPQKRMAECADFVAMAYKEAMDFLGNEIEYKGYRVLSPEERVAFEMTMKKAGRKGAVRAGAPIAISELELVVYEFVSGPNVARIHVYLPYLVDGQMIVRGTRTFLMYGITEKTFSRTGKNGITLRVIRQLLNFYKDIHFMMTSVSSDWASNEFIITCKLHKRDSKRRNVKMTVTHYLLCKYGLMGLLERFGIPAKAVTLVTEITDTSRYEYFHARKLDAADDEPIYMKVRKTVLENPIWRKLLANILYLISQFKGHETIEDLLHESQTRYLVYLGDLLYQNFSEAKDASQGATHFYSVNFFLDPMTRNRLKAFGIDVRNIWDLLQYVFTEIDTILLNTSHQDMYDKRIVITDLMLTKLFVVQIFHKAYRVQQNARKFDKNTLSSTVKINPTVIRSIDRVENAVSVKSDIVNGNAFLAFMTKRIRLSGSKASRGSLNAEDMRFHSSVAVVEALIGTVGGTSVSGDINPFLELGPEGGIIRPETHADEIDSLKDFIPYN